MPVAQRSEQVVVTDLTGIPEVDRPLVVQRFGEYVYVRRGRKGEGGLWAVSVAPSDTRALLTDNRDDALNFAGIFEMSVPASVLGNAEGKRVFKQLPKWVKAWGKACNQAGAYLDPTTFVKGTA